MRIYPRHRLDLSAADIAAALQASVTARDADALEAAALARGRDGRPRSGVPVGALSLGSAAARARLAGGQRGDRLRDHPPGHDHDPPGPRPGAGAGRCGPGHTGALGRGPGAGRHRADPRRAGGAPVRRSARPGADQRVLPAARPDAGRGQRAGVHRPGQPRGHRRRRLADQLRHDQDRLGGRRRAGVGDRRRAAVQHEQGAGRLAGPEPCGVRGQVGQSRPARDLQRPAPVRRAVPAVPPAADRPGCGDQRLDPILRHGRRVAGPDPAAADAGAARPAGPAARPGRP